MVVIDKYRIDLFYKYCEKVNDAQMSNPKKLFI